MYSGAIDNLYLTCLGRRKSLALWVALTLYEIPGTPFSYAKFSGGLQVQFVGYLLDYRGCLLGITSKRVEWLVSFIDGLHLAKGTVYMRRLNDFSGRLGFVARVLVWLKPFFCNALRVELSTGSWHSCEGPTPNWSLRF